MRRQDTGSADIDAGNRVRSRPPWKLRAVSNEAMGEWDDVRVKEQTGAQYSQYKKRLAVKGTSTGKWPCWLG